MRRAIQRYIEDELSSQMIGGSVPDGSDIFCTVKDADSLAFEIKANHGPKAKVGVESAGKEE